LARKQWFMAYTDWLWQT